MKTKILILGVFMSLSFFISCSSNDKNQDTTAVTSEDVAADANIDNAADDVALIAEDQFAVQKSSVARTSAPIASILPPCSIMTTVLANGTWTRTIDFGTQGCALQNGNILKGKIIISFANDFTILTRTLNYSFDGFYHNNNHIEGNKTIVQTVKSSALLATPHPVSTHTVDMKVTFANGNIYTRTGTRIREMTAGFTTLASWKDDVFMISGDHSTVLANGTILTNAITTPLKIVMSCQMPFPVKGVISIVKNNKTAVLDFGTGTCDSLATLTINGVTKEIRLGK